MSPSRLCISLFLFVAAGSMLVDPVAAQDMRAGRATALTNQERAVRVSFQPTYQRFSDDELVLTQSSTPLSIIVPFRDQWQLTVQGSAATVGGDNLTTVSGISDVEATVSYAASVGAGSVIGTISATAPTGTDRHTRDEFDTVTLLSQDLYPVRVPGFGHGGGVGGGATWAVSVDESFVVGIGASYRHRGGYKPVEGLQGTYNPGNETRLTGGFDYRIGPTSALSADVSFFLYGTDTLDYEEQFNVGNRLFLRVRYLREWGFRSLRVRVRYEEQNESAVPNIGQKLQAVPSQVGLHVRYGTRLTDDLRLDSFSAIRWYDETATLGAKGVGAVGVEPQVVLTDQFVAVPRFVLTIGGITGIEAGLGFSWTW